MVNYNTGKYTRTRIKITYNILYTRIMNIYNIEYKVVVCMHVHDPQSVGRSIDLMESTYRKSTLFKHTVIIQAITSKKKKKRLKCMHGPSVPAS